MATAPGHLNSDQAEPVHPLQWGHMDHISNYSNTPSHTQTIHQLVNMWSGFEGQERGECSGGEGKGSWMFCCWAAVGVVQWTVQREV